MDSRLYLSAIGLSPSEVSDTLHYLRSFPESSMSTMSPFLLNIVVQLAVCPKDPCRRSTSCMIFMWIESAPGKKNGRTTRSITRFKLKFLANLPHQCIRTARFNTTLMYLEFFWEEAKDMMIRRPMDWHQPDTENDPDLYRPKVLSHALLKLSRMIATRWLETAKSDFCILPLEIIFVASQIKRAIKSNHIPEEIRACIKRPISSGLADLIAFSESTLDQQLQLILETSDSGLVNVLSVLIAAIEQQTLSADEAEATLARTLGSKEIGNADFSGMRLEGLHFNGLGVQILRLQPVPDSQLQVL